ncbi:hypothetical protein ACFVS2_26565 [Brevibacillus sp. NPDC058079]|uniref:hypothetical protein n=1 Tax=Brevibacillus sp. NPDC058079 TaxID=3346330 RepID=UPI0036EE0013
MILDTTTNQIVTCFFRKVERAEIKSNRYHPKGGWDFDWLKPITHSFDVFGIVTEEYPGEVQGLIALKPNYDEDYRCVDVELIESAPRNKKEIKGIPNPDRKYIGVGKCLVAFACEYSFGKGLEGFIELTSKTSKFDFYGSLGAVPTFSQNMMIDDKTAIQLTKKYFKGGVQWWKG